MNYPFYRHVKYLDDGHELYQCLSCGEKIDVGAPYFCFSPSYCCFCGVQYKGCILPKKYDWVDIEPGEEMVYIIQEGIVWEGNEDCNWDDCWMKTNNPFDAIENLKHQKEYRKEDNDDPSPYKTYKYVFRIIRRKEMKYYGYMKIDVDKYYRKTGKKYKRKL